MKTKKNNNNKLSNLTVNAKVCNSESNPNPNPNFQSRLIR